MTLDPIYNQPGQLLVSVTGGQLFLKKDNAVIEMPRRMAMALAAEIIQRSTAGDFNDDRKEEARFEVSITEYHPGKPITIMVTHNPKESTVHFFSLHEARAMIAMLEIVMQEAGGE
jgi:hypothetical protein